jgi:folate-binding protein YgfZ
MRCILNSRGCIIITGDDRFNFLQGLITNDIKTLEKQTAIYACILSPQGKYLADLFVIKLNDSLLIDIPEKSSQELLLKLNMYKLRSLVTISYAKNIKIIASDKLLNNFDKELVSFNDPRNIDLGVRYYINENNLDAIDNLENLEELYDLKRIELRVAEGEKDLIVNKSFPLEYELDRLNAFSFDKGCYVGQEVVSRTKYQGVIRKKIYKIQANNAIEPCQEIIVEGNKMGVICSVVGNIGLALLYKESYHNLTNNQVVTDCGNILTITEN